MDITVQKDIPLPKTHRPNASAHQKYPLSTMKVGDMFFVPADENKLATHVSARGKQLGRKFATRFTTMKETLDGWKPCDPGDKRAVTGVGVWRVE